MTIRAADEAPTYLQGNIVVRPFAEQLLLARASSAAYIVDTIAREEAVAALGLDYVMPFGDEECQGYLARWDDRLLVVHQGTRVTSNLDVAELWDDVNSDTVKLPNGTHVHAGFWNPLNRVWERELLGPVSAARKVEITGHSLGGVRAHLTAFFTPGRVTSFGAPKGAKADFWKAAYTGRELPLRLVHERDFAPGWPPFRGFTQPGQMLWLHDGTATMCDTRGGIDESVADHSIDDGYIPALAALAESETVAA